MPSRGDILIVWQAKESGFDYIRFDIVSYVPSTSRSFRDCTPIYCPLGRAWSLMNKPFPLGIEPRVIAWQYITLPLCQVSSTHTLKAVEIPLENGSWCNKEGSEEGRSASGYLRLNGQKNISRHAWDNMYFSGLYLDHSVAALWLSSFSVTGSNHCGVIILVELTVMFNYWSLFYISNSMPNMVIILCHIMIFPPGK